MIKLIESFIAFENIIQAIVGVLPAFGQELVPLLLLLLVALLYLLHMNKNLISGRRQRQIKSSSLSDCTQ